MFPKTVNGLTRRDEQRARANADKAAERECYRLVDIRDQGRCRICGRHVTPGAVDGRARAEHNRMVKRSQGGPHETRNVHLICASRCHDDIHVRGLLKVSGDADARDERGRLCGIKVERYREHGWEVTGWA